MISKLFKVKHYYSAHVPVNGWMDAVTATGDDNTPYTGTVGKSRLADGFKINLEGIDGVKLKYSVHNRQKGWSEFVDENIEAGEIKTEGLSNADGWKQAEAIKITVAEGYDKLKAAGYEIQYRVHLGYDGWEKEWTVADDSTVVINKRTENSQTGKDANGNKVIAGSVGWSRRIEALQVKLVKTEPEKLEVALKVNEVTPSDTKALQDVAVTGEDEITLYTEASKLNDGAKLDFALQDLPEGVTFVPGDGIEGEAKDGKVEAKVKATLGNYTFTLTDGVKEKNVTVKVIDATMPTSYTFRLYRDEDVNGEKDANILANTKTVRETTTDFSADKTADITFQGNINAMASKSETENNKYYRVRVQVKDVKAADVIAVRKDGTPYQTAPVADNEYELYVYLDAEESTTDLVIANKNASKKQISKETASCHKVTFKSKSKIWLRDAKASGNGAYKNNTAITKAEVNAENNRIIDVGVKLDDALAGVKLTEKNGTITAENGNEYWVPFYVQVGEDSVDVQDAIVVSGNDNVKIATNDIKTSGMTDGCAIMVWVKVNKTDMTQEFPFKLTYNQANVKEELDVKVVVHNAVAPKIIGVTSGNEAVKVKSFAENTTSSKPTTRARIDDINVEVYKHGMKPTSRVDYTGTEKTGRWYSLTLEFNVPVDSMLFNNSGNEFSSAPAVSKNGWVKFADSKTAQADGNKLTIWINADDIEKETEKTSKSVQQTVCNKWALGTGEDTKGTWTVGINVNETEVSKTALHHEISATNTTSDVWESQVKDTITASDLNNLNGICIETIKEDKNRTSNGTNYGTFAYTLDKTKNNGTTVENQVDPETDINTATIKLNSANVSDILLKNNDKELEGRWILVHFAVRGDAKSIISKTDSDGVIIDTANRSALLKSTSTNENTDRIPLWINLDDKGIQAATKHKDSKGEPTPFKVTFGSTNPVEEENYFYIVIDDQNANAAEIPESAKPDGIDVGELDEKTAKSEEVAKLFPEDEKATKSHLTGKAVEAFVHNQKALADFDINKEIVGDTVYVTVKGDYTKLLGTDGNTYATGKDFNVAFDLDLSSICKTGNSDIYFYNDGTNKWIKSKVDTNKHCHFGLTIYKKFDEIKNANGLTKEYIFSCTQGTDNDKDCSKLKDKYIRYVFTFVQK